jgi:Family of unknown function (DUF6065)
MVQDRDSDEGPMSDVGLPRLTAYALDDWAIQIVPASAEREWMSSTDQRFANRCLPMLIANQSGWLLLNNLPFRALWTGGDGADSLTVSYERRDGPPLAGSHFGYGLITWTIPYLFRTSPGYNLLARGPANCPKDAAYALEGVVETDWAASTFTMNWKITRPFTPIRFEAQEPICMIVPQRRGELEEFAPEIRPIDGNPELQEQYQAWSSSRDRFLQTLGSSGRDGRAPRWQRDYFQGRHVGSDRSQPEHQTRLDVRPFETQPS